jgi:hypothetical protein
LSRADLNTVLARNITDSFSPKVSPVLSFSLT